LPEGDIVLGRGAKGTFAAVLSIVLIDSLDVAGLVRA
jgi:hypothetical protein